MATPFDAEGALDFDALRHLIGQQLEGGTQALVVAGSTGEAHMLRDDEFVRLVAFVVETVAGRVPVVAGTGGAATAETIARTREAAAAGADAALVVTPYYVRPDQSGLLRHFTAVADEGGLPVVLYNVPTRTGCDLLPQTLALLRGHPRIVGVKEAFADPVRIRDVADLAGDGFVFLSGDDASAAEAMLAGAAGTVSVVANLVPRHFRALCDAARGDDAAVAAQLAAELKPLLDALGCAPNPIPVKAGLAEIGIARATLRAPLYELPQGEARARLADALRRFPETTRKH